MANKFFNNTHRLIGLILITAFVVSCGGGGDGGGTPGFVDLGKGFNKSRGFNDSVFAIVPASDKSGDVYIGGRFISYNDTAVNRLVRLNSDSSIDTDFNTQTEDGFSGYSYILSLALANDNSGDLYVGGFFTEYSGTDVNHLLRLNDDGSFDSGFDTVTDGGFNASVQAITLAADTTGDLYVGGQFTLYKGITINHLVRLNRDGSIDASFDTQTGGGFDATVQSITPAKDGSGDLYVGGQFTTYKGIAANGLVRLNNDGSIDNGFVTGTGFNGQVRSIAMESSGGIYVGGTFNLYNGTEANRMLRLKNDGSIDSNFLVGSGFNGQVQSIVTTDDTSGDVYVGGGYSSYNNIAVKTMVRLNSNGSIDSEFITGGGFNDWVQTIALAEDTSGDVYIGGDFTSHKSTAVNRMVRLDRDGRIDSGFNILTGSGFNLDVESIVPTTNGSGDVYVGGWFSLYNGTAVNNLVRLNSDGSLDNRFDTQTRKGFNGQVLSIALATDGSGDVYAGGGFTVYNSSTASSIVRLNNDGSLDENFFTGSGFNGEVFSLALARDNSGDIYVAGDFTSYNGTAVNYVVRLNSDGSIDNGFDTLGGNGFNARVRSIALATDNSGAVYVGGEFTSYNGTVVNRMLRLTSNGSIDTGFDSVSGKGFDNDVYHIVVATDGSADVYVAGNFSTYNDTLVDYLVRLNNDGSIDTDFNTQENGGFDDAVYSLALAVDGSGDIYIGGLFSSYNGVAANKLLRLNNNGSQDNDFKSMEGGGGFNHDVLSIATVTDGSDDIYVGGTFTSYNGTTVDTLVRLDADGSVD